MSNSLSMGKCSLQENYLRPWIIRTLVNHVEVSADEASKRSQTTGRRSWKAFTRLRYCTKTPKLDHAPDSMPKPNLSKENRKADLSSLLGKSSTPSICTMLISRTPPKRYTMRCSRGVTGIHTSRLAPVPRQIYFERNDSMKAFYCAVS